jgi:hypothetical protein
MCRERLWYRFSSDKEKKDILEAIKNETKISKKIPIYNTKNEEIGKVLKFDTYTSYFDFWLEDYISEEELSFKGKIETFEIVEVENNKGVKIKRIKNIIA